MIHSLKTWPQFFSRILSGDKKFELRENDRDFQAGDILLLQEWSPSNNEYTGNSIYKKVTYVLHGGMFGLSSLSVVMSLADCTESEALQHNKNNQ